jgi:hypothetical protein
LLLACPAPTGFAAAGQSFEVARSHWAYQPIRTPVPPKVRGAERLQTPIDTFLLTKLEAHGLTFTPPADKRTLLRRAYFDLIGLPPTFEQIRAFERDPAPDAFVRVVDQLLGSPRYGERWGRHWLDAARYADTKDLVLLYGKDAVRPYAYTYRDYVIRAFNEDLPYDQFVRDQLAADLARPERPPWRLAALGFLTLGRLFDNNPHDQIDDQIDTVTRGFLGLTVACARCHDHKYDAITMEDYYGLYGVFASAERPFDLPLIEDPNQVPGGIEFEEKLGKARQELEQHIDAEFAKLTETLRQRIGDYLVRAATTPPDITETAQFALSLTPEDFRPSLMLRTRRFIDERAKPGDRVFGPWAELMSLSDEEFTAKSGGVMEHLKRRSGEGAGRFNASVVEALSRAALTNKASVAKVYGQVLLEAYEESKKPAAGSATGGSNADQRELADLVASPQAPIWFPRRDTPNHMSRPDKDRYNTLVLNLDKLAAHATNAPPARAMVVRDLPEPYEPHVFLRGSPSRPGPPTKRAFVRLFSEGETRPFVHGSGRLELADAITDRTNPLTARVLVNRVWMHHFGEPLVASTTDFGARSEPPANPELLDWLASEFVRSGWSVKHLHRLILLSSAYQQGAAPQVSTPDQSQDTGHAGKTVARTRPGVAGISPSPGGEGRGERGRFRSPDFHETSPSLRQARSPVESMSGLQIDPDNRLLWHFPRRRLDLEAMRDSMLFLSGRLDTAMGGRPVDVAGDPLNQRRTVYGLVDRQNLPDLFRAFDFAVPDQCAERRPRTTVPQQALYALNSPFVMRQAQALAAQPEIANETDPARRVDAFFRRVLGRHATGRETASALKFIGAAGADPDAQNSDSGPTPWEQFAQVLLASNEALFVD